MKARTLLPRLDCEPPHTGRGIYSEVRIKLQGRDCIQIIFHASEVRSTTRRSGFIAIK